MINLKVKVKPNSAKNEIVSFDKNNNSLVVKIAAVPEKDKANRELIKFLSKKLKKKVRIVKGLKSREKIISLFHKKNTSV